MNVHFERNSNAKCDCTILNLTWMGKVPDELPEVSVRCRAAPRAQREQSLDKSRVARSE